MGENGIHISAIRRMNSDSPEAFDEGYACAEELVRGIHTPSEGHNPDCHCGAPAYSGKACEACGEDWPCMTVQVLEEWRRSYG